MSEPLAPDLAALATEPMTAVRALRVWLRLFVLKFDVDPETTSVSGAVLAPNGDRTPLGTVTLAQTLASVDELIATESSAAWGDA